MKGRKVIEQTKLDPALRKWLDHLSDLRDGYALDPPMPRLDEIMVSVFRRLSRSAAGTRPPAERKAGPSRTPSF